MVYAYGLLLLETFGALEASDCEVDFFSLCVVWVPEKFVDPSQAGQSPFDGGVAVVDCHCFNVFAHTFGFERKRLFVFLNAPIDKCACVGII